MKYHYTYWITNIKDGKHYIGVRSSNNHPIKDLGLKYFTSKRKDGKIDKDFITHQKINHQDYEYKIVGMFPTRGLAVLNEIELHETYDVKNNDSFYNKSNQTSTGFDTTGIIYTEERKNKIKGRRHSDETKIKMSNSHKNIKFTDKHKENLGKSHKNIKHTTETKETLRKKNTGKFFGKRKIIYQINIITGYIVKNDYINNFINDGFIASKIYMCCNGKRKTHRGFIWKYEVDNNFILPDFTNKQLGSGKIIEQIDIVSNKIIKEATINIFINEGFDYSNISKCCLGKNKFHKGFRWKYKNL